MKTWFQHPQAPGSHVYVIFDVCHMIKLVIIMCFDFSLFSSILTSCCSSDLIVNTPKMLLCFQVYFFISYSFLQ